MIAGNFDPGFFVEHFLKDMGIALEESRRMGLKLPGLELPKNSTAKSPPKAWTATERTR